MSGVTVFVAGAMLDVSASGFVLANAVLFAGFCLTAKNSSPAAFVAYRELAFSDGSSGVSKCFLSCLSSCVDNRVDLLRPFVFLLLMQSSWCAL